MNPFAVDAVFNIVLLTPQACADPEREIDGSRPSTGQECGLPIERVCGRRSCGRRGGRRVHRPCGGVVARHLPRRWDPERDREHGESRVIGRSPSGGGGRTIDARRHGSGRRAAAFRRDAHLGWGAGSGRRGTRRPVRTPRRPAAYPVTNPGASSIDVAADGSTALSRRRSGSIGVGNDDAATGGTGFTGIGLGGLARNRRRAGSSRARPGEPWKRPRVTVTLHALPPSGQASAGPGHHPVDRGRICVSRSSARLSRSGVDRAAIEVRLRGRRRRRDGGVDIARRQGAFDVRLGDGSRRFRRSHESGQTQMAW